MKTITHIGVSQSTLWRRANPEKYQKQLENSIINRRFQAMKTRAKEHNRQFNITQGYLENLIEQSGMKCAISGVPLTEQTNSKNVLSFDRTDNTQGYVYGNIEVVSKQINIAKHELTKQEFIEMCTNVVKHNLTLDEFIKLCAELAEKN